MDKKENNYTKAYGFTFIFLNLVVLLPTHIVKDIYYPDFGAMQFVYIYSFHLLVAAIIATIVIETIRAVNKRKASKTVKKVDEI